MGDKSRITWTDATWNPVTGCTPISAGCLNCYAKPTAERLQRMHTPGYEHGFEVTCHPNRLDIPLRWKRPRKIFVNSMSDLFHGRVDADFLRRVFDVMNRCPQHTFQILTKRAGYLAYIASTLTWTPNIWMGVTVEDKAATDRIDCLRSVPAAVRFLSCEPLLEDIAPINLNGIHWVIAGGESGPNARPLDLLSIRGVRDWCLAGAVPFFFKQWGSHAGRDFFQPYLDGVIWHQFPGHYADETR